MNKSLHIVFANFKFKIIYKILADRLAQIMSNLVSKEQRGFIRDSKIRYRFVLSLKQSTFGTIKLLAVIVFLRWT